MCFDAFLLLRFTNDNYQYKEDGAGHTCVLCAVRGNRRYYESVYEFECSAANVIVPTWRTIILFLGAFSFNAAKRQVSTLDSYPA